MLRSWRRPGPGGKVLCRFGFARLHWIVSTVLCAGWSTVLAGCGTDAVAPAPATASLSATVLSFPSATVGSAGPTSTVTLTNTGGQSLLLTGAGLSDTVDFGFTTTCGSTLAPGAHCDYAVQFHPQSAAALSGTLTLTDNSGGVSGAEQVVTLGGTGTPVPVPEGMLSPASVSFGQSVLHSAAAAQTVTLSNLGTAALEISRYSLNDTADFSVAGTTCGSELAAGASCTFSVVFAPQTVGAVSGTLTVTDNSGGGNGAQQTTALSGTGLAIPVSQLMISPASLSFAPTVLKSTATATVTLSNEGTASLAIGGVAVSDKADYAVSSTCGATLAAGASCALAVNFTPQTAGALPSTLTLTDNSGVASGTVQQEIALSGTGLPVPVGQAALTPGMAAFGGVNVGSASAAQAFTLTNSGTAALAIGGTALSDTADFALTNGCGASLATGASCTLSVLFQPQTAGVLSAVLTLTDNSGGTSGAQQSVALSGTGLALPAPLAVLAPGMLSFPDTMATLSAPAQMVTLSNTGNAPLIVSGVTLSDTEDFSLASNCAATLAAGTSCTLTLLFQPQTVAGFHATLTVADNSGATGSSGTGTAQQNVVLAGSGIAFAEPRVVLSPTTIAFPQVVTNASAPAQTVTLTNTGTTPLTVASVALNGTAAAAFQVSSGNCVGTVTPGASCTETVVYSPTLGSAGDAAGLVFTDNALGQAGSTQTVALTGSALAEVDSVENFGDSITCGFYALPNDGTGLVYSMEGYAGLFDAWLGVPAQNWCRQGDTAADLSRLWVPFHSTPTRTGNQLFTLMIGANDAYRYGIPQSALQTYTQEVGAAVAWLAMPNVDKVLANAATQQSGTWNPDVGFGLMSSDAGASLTFNVNQAVAGRNLYMVYHVWALPSGQAGKAAIAVDGVVQATVDESQDSLVQIPTENGTQDTFLVQTVPLGAVGQHTVTFSSLGPSGSKVGLLWAGVTEQDYRAVDGAPRVLLGLITNSPSGNQTYAADIYNLQLKSLVPALAADGMNVEIVPTDRVMDPGTDFADILHPNSAGHAKLAAAFEQYR